MLETDQRRGPSQLPQNRTFIQDAFSLPFTDPNWAVKLAVGTGLFFAGNIVPVLPLIVFWGYLYRIHKRVVKEDSGPQLPEWDDWGGLFMDGLKYLGALLVYMLPMIVLFIGGLVLLFGAFLGSAIAASSTVSESSDLGLLFSILVPLGPLGLVLILLGVLCSPVIGIISHAGLVHMSAEDRFDAAFQFRVWIRNLRANLGGYLLAYFLIIGLSVFAVSMIQVLYLTIVLCLLVPVILGATCYYMGVVAANLYADAYRVGKERLGELPSID